MNTIEDIDEGFAQTKGEGSTSSNGLESLPEGDYVFQIEKGQTKDTKAGPIVQLKCIVLAPGTKFDGARIDHSYFLTEKAEGEGRVVSSRQVDLLKKDLKTLGFDVDQWTPANGRRLSVELPKAYGVMPGLRFHGKKTTKPKDQPGQFWHNLYVNARTKDDGRPEKFGPEELESASFDFG